MAPPVNPRLSSGQRIITERAMREQVYGVGIYVTAAIPKAVAEAFGTNASPMTKAVYDAVGRGVLPSDVMLEANREIARRAQHAIVTGWRARLPLKSGPYRRGSNPKKDRLSGALGEALADPSMIRGTSPRGISFLNLNELSNQARHWYRVNYGAFGPKATIRRPKAYPVTVDGHTVFSLQDEHQPASQSWLPQRFIMEGSELIPRRGPADVRGGGSRAALFTDLGFKSVGENVDPVYRAMIRSYFAKGGMKQRYKAKGVTLKVKSKS